MKDSLSPIPNEPVICPTEILHKRVKIQGINFTHRHFTDWVEIYGDFREKKISNVHPLYRKLNQNKKQLVNRFNTFLLSCQDVKWLWVTGQENLFGGSLLSEAEIRFSDCVFCDHLSF